LPSLKHKLAQEQAVVGTWVTFSDPACMEILSQAGFDFLLIDAEHAPISDDTLRNLLIAGKGSPTALLVRVPWNDPVRIKIVLDLGAEGVMVPMVNSAEEARRAVAACKYPSEGIRSVGPWRPSNYYQDGDDYLRRANAEVAVIIQAEHIHAVEALDEILRVPGIDAVFIGPSDLAASLNHLTDTRHPDVQTAIDRIAASCRAAGVVFGTDAYDAQHLAGLGARLFTTGIDTWFLADGAKRAAYEVRTALGLNL
jgi:4-hydroxy-2-oxoheptanedioate aldolase